jgi:hypothetical protein
MHDNIFFYSLERKSVCGHKIHKIYKPVNQSANTLSLTREEVVAIRALLTRE